MVTAMAAAHQTTARVVADQDALQQTIGGVELGASRPSQRPAHWRAGGAPPAARRRTVDCQTQGPCKRGLRAALVRFRRSRCTGGEVNTHLIRPRRCSRRPLGTGSARSAAMGRSDQGVTLEYPSWLRSIRSRSYPAAASRFLPGCSQHSAAKAAHGGRHQSTWRRPGRRMANESQRPPG